MIRAPSLHRDFMTRAKLRWASSISCCSRSRTRFNSGATDPDDPKVEKMVGQLGMGNNKKMPKSVHLLIAQLAFANSDLAFQGNHLFQGNFYGVSIYDISNPAKTTVADVDGLPGRTGRCVGIQESAVHVGRDAEWTPGLRRRGISAGTAPPADEDKDKDKRQG